MGTSSNEIGTFSLPYIYMSLNQHQHGEFTSGGVTCQSFSTAVCGFFHQGTPLAKLS